MTQCQQPLILQCKQKATLMEPKEMTTTPPATTPNPHQPGKRWVVLDDGDGTINITLPLGFGKQKRTVSLC